MTAKKIDRPPMGEQRVTERAGQSFLMDLLKQLLVAL